MRKLGIGAMIIILLIALSAFVGLVSYRSRLHKTIEKGSPRQENIAGYTYTKRPIRTGYRKGMKIVNMDLGGSKMDKKNNASKAEKPDDEFSQEFDIEYEDENITFFRFKDSKNLWMVPTCIREDFLKKFTVESFEDPVRGNVFVINEFGRPIKYVRYTKQFTSEATKREDRLEQLIEELLPEEDARYINKIVTLEAAYRENRLDRLLEKLPPQERERIKEEAKSIYDDPDNYQIGKVISTSTQTPQGWPRLPEVEAVIWYETTYKGEKYILLGPPPELLGVKRSNGGENREGGISSHTSLELEDNDGEELETQYDEAEPPINLLEEPMPFYPEGEVEPTFPEGEEEQMFPERGVTELYYEEILGELLRDSLISEIAPEDEELLKMWLEYHRLMDWQDESIFPFSEGRNFLWEDEIIDQEQPKIKTGER